MGANAQTSVPTFTAGEVLTAANMNISARTGIPVFATSTTRDAAFGGTGEKTLAEGQFAYLEDSNTTQYYDGAAWQAVGGASGLTLISATTIGTTVASVTVSSAFSSTYENYRIILSGGVASTDNSLSLTLGATATGYYRAAIYNQFGAGTPNGSVQQNSTSWIFAAQGTTNSLNGVIDLFSPNLAKYTHYWNVTSQSTAAGYVLHTAGYLANTTQYTAFTLTTDTGTITGGTIRVYGYQNS
jgi:hypothetical protein